MRLQGKDMRNGTTTQPAKAAAQPCAPRHRVAHPQPDQILIETLPRIEIAVTRSFKRRKHFLIETRLAVSFSGSPVFESRKSYNLRHNIARKSFKTKDRPQINPRKFAGGTPALRRAVGTRRGMATEAQRKLRAGGKIAARLLAGGKFSGGFENLAGEIICDFGFVAGFS